jgi:hypothetical protein
MATMKMQWIVQLAFPWMASDPDEPKAEVKRRRRVPRFTKPCAQAIAEMSLCELGPDVKARIFNPTTGEYEALLYTENAENPQERIKVYHGRENRDKSAA